MKRTYFYSVEEEDAAMPEGSRMHLEPTLISRNIAMMRLRQATDADDEFCFRLNVATMREYVEPIYGWDVDIQNGQHAGWFNPNRLSIIEDDDGTPIGVLDVSDKDDHLYLSRIEVLPEVQGRGVGTAVMEGLMMQGQTIRLRVFTNNVRAQRFYERLGFIVDLDSEDEHHVSMHRSGEDFNLASVE